jgi:hypothetical protein
MGRPYIINVDSVRGVYLTFAPLGMQLLLILSIRVVVPAAVLDLGRGKRIGLLSVAIFRGAGDGLVGDGSQSQYPVISLVSGLA